MADKREEVSSKLQEQQDKLSQLEEKLQQLLSGGSNDGGNRRSNDSGTITWSDEETNTIKVKHYNYYICLYIDIDYYGVVLQLNNT